MDGEEVVAYVCRAGGKGLGGERVGVGLLTVRCGVPSQGQIRAVLAGYLGAIERGCEAVFETQCQSERARGWSEERQSDE